MKIAYNPKEAGALDKAPDALKNDIVFDLAGKKIFVKDVEFKGTDTVYSVFKKDTSEGGGCNGLVPKPNYNSDSKTRYLREDGTWVIPTNTDNKVFLSKSTIANFRPIILGYDNDANKDKILDNQTAQVYTAANIYALPSTGNLYANAFKGQSLTANYVYFNKPTKAGETRGFIFNGVTDSAALYYVEPNLKDDGRLRFKICDNPEDAVLLTWRLWDQKIPDDLIIHTFTGYGYTLSPLDDQKVGYIRPSKNGEGFIGTSSNRWAFMYAGKFIGHTDWSTIDGKPSSYTPSSHTHNYAGSDKSGGAAYQVYEHSNIVDFNTLTGDNNCGKLYYSGGSNKSTHKPSGVDAYGALVFKAAGGYTALLLASSNIANGLYFRCGPDTSIGNWHKLAYSDHTHDTSQINALTNYTIANKREVLTTTDTLNSALGKLEYNTNLGLQAYDLVYAANNGETIDNLKEILKVLNGIKDTDTIKALLGKYLPLTGGILTGSLTIKGSAASHPLTVRGIIGYNGTDDVAELYLQYQVNKPIMLGNDARYSISADGSEYSGTAAHSNTTKRLNSNTELIKGQNFLQYYNQQFSNTSGFANAGPAKEWYHIIRMNHGNSAGYFGELALGINSTDLWYRRANGGTAKEWVRVWDTLSLTKLSLLTNDLNLHTKYVTLDTNLTISGTKTFSTPINSSYTSGTWITSVSNAALNCTYTSYGGIFNAKVKTGRIALSTYPHSTNYVYIGYASDEQIKNNTNSFNKETHWNADNGIWYANGFNKHDGTSVSYEGHTHSQYVTLNTLQTITSTKFFNADIHIPTGHYLYGHNEGGGAMIFFDGTKTIIGSIGSKSTVATHVRSKTGHMTIGTNNNATYTIWDSGNLSKLSQLTDDLNKYVTLSTKLTITESKTFTKEILGTSTKAKLLVGYMSSRPTDVNFVSLGDCGLYRTIVKADVKNSPGFDANLMHLSWDNDGWASQLAISVNTNNMSFRYMNNKSWSSWKKLLNNENWSLFITIPKVTDYYWANIKVSDKSDITTTPTFKSLRLSETLLIGGSLYWDNATYRQRITITDDSKIGTSVFNFLQSTDSGKTFTTLAFIKDNGLIQSNGFVKTGGEGKKVLLDNGNSKNISDFSLAHNHPYLPLAGGKMNSEAKITFPINRAKPEGGGWAYTPIKIIKQDESVIFHLGVFGSNNDYMYTYLGTNDHTSAENVRIYPTGVIYSKGFKKGDLTNEYILLAGGGDIAKSSFWLKTELFSRLTNINGTNWAMAGTTKGNAFTLYGPTTAGSKGLILISTGATPEWKDISTIGIIEIKKNLTLTTSWLDTGIAGTNLVTGTYIILISGMSSATTSLYNEIYSGIMSWFEGECNNDDSDEIILHKAGHASNNRTIYLRTCRTSRPGYLKLLIAASTTFSSSNYTFKFKRIM